MNNKINNKKNDIKSNKKKNIDKKIMSDIKKILNKLNKNLSIKTNFEKVIQFHKLAGIEPKTKINQKDKNFRISLLKEEFNEYLKAEENNNIENILKEMADIIYIVYGTAYYYNYNMDMIFNKVHQSNLTKVTSDKIIKNKNNKIIKPKGYKKVKLDLKDYKLI